MDNGQNKASTKSLDKYRNLNCGQAGVANQWGKGGHFKKWCQDSGLSIEGEEIKSLNHPVHKHQSRWMKDFHRKGKTIKLLGSIIGTNL